MTQPTSRTPSTAAGVGATASLPLPPAVNENDILLVGLAFQGGTGQTITPPAGFTLVAGTRRDSGTALGVAVYQKAAGASETGPYDFGLSSSDDYAAVCVPYFDGNATGRLPTVDAQNGQANASSTSVLSPQVTTAVAEEALLFWGAVNAGTTLTAPGGMTELADVRSGTGLGGTAAAKTLYLTGGTLTNSFQPMQDGGVAPTDAFFATATGWISGANANGTMSEFRPNTNRARTTFSATAVPTAITTGANANAFRSPTAYNGSFASGNWTLSASMRAAVAQPSTLRLRWRVFASTDATGATGMRELTTGVLLSNAVADTTTANSTRTVTWAAPLVTLTDEYLFFACALEMVALSGTGNTRDNQFRQNSASAVTTTTFTPALNAALELAEEARPTAGATGSRTATAANAAVNIGTLVSVAPPVVLTAQADLALRWATKEAVAGAGALRWATKQAISDAADLRWATRERLSDGATLFWATKTRAAVEKALALRWGTRRVAGGKAVPTGESVPTGGLVPEGVPALSLSWATRQSASDAADLRWRTAAPVSDSLALLWQTQGGPVAVESAVALRWATKEALSDAADIRWATRQAISDAADLRWITRQAVSDAADLRWVTRQAISDATDLRWATRQAASDALDLRWISRQAVADALALRWATRIAASDALALSWATRQPASDSLSLLWRTEQQAGVVEAMLALRWATREAAQDSTGLLWGTRVSASDSTALAWGTRVSASDAAALLWTTKQAVADAAVLRWGTRAAIADSVALSWATRISAADALALAWATLATAGVEDALALRWVTRQAVGDAADLRWGVRTSVADSVALSWATRTAAARALALYWATRGYVEDSAALRWQTASLLVVDIDRAYVFVVPVENRTVRAAVENRLARGAAEDRNASADPEDRVGSVAAEERVLRA